MRKNRQGKFNPTFFFVSTNSPVTIGSDVELVTSHKAWISLGPANTKNT